MSHFFNIFFLGECIMRKIIVVGAVAGGATCASQIRRLDKDSEITIFEKDRDMSFANCGSVSYTHLTLPTNREV